MLPSAVLTKMALERQTDRLQSDRLWLPFFCVEIRDPKNRYLLKSIPQNGIDNANSNTFA